MATSDTEVSLTPSSYVLHLFSLFFCKYGRVQILNLMSMRLKLYIMYSLRNRKPFNVRRVFSVVKNKFR